MRTPTPTLTNSDNDNNNHARHDTTFCPVHTCTHLLLVGQSFDWGGVDDALLVVERLGDGVFRDGRLAGRRVRRHEHGLVALDARDGAALERVQRELVLLF